MSISKIMRVHFNGDGVVSGFEELPAQDEPFAWYYVDVTGKRRFADDAGASGLRNPLFTRPQQPAQVCQHRIVDARNPVVKSGYMCIDCGALFSAADHHEQPAQDVDWEKLYRLEVKRKEALAAKYERDTGKILTYVVSTQQRMAVRHQGASASESEPQQLAQHPDDMAVDRFAKHMKAKMAKQRAKGYGDWYNRDTYPAAHLQSLLINHLSKGDPLDVGNFAMMLWSRGEKTAAPKPAQDERVAKACNTCRHCQKSEIGLHSFNADVCRQCCYYFDSKYEYGYESGVKK